MNENPATKVKFDNRTVIGVSLEWDYQFSSNIEILGMQITPGQISCSGAADQQIMNSFFVYMILFGYNLVICFY